VRQVIPQLVSDYLERALPGERSVPRQMRISQEGRMWSKPAASQRRFTATQRLAVEVTTQAGGEATAVTLEFDAEGEIVRASADARPFGRKGTWTPTPWAGEFSGYREFGGIRMPANAEVSWDLPAGRYVYWRGTVTSALALDTPFERRS
jgi:hypothetical protein